MHTREGVVYDWIRSQLLAGRGGGWDVVGRGVRERLRAGDRRVVITVELVVAACDSKSDWDKVWLLGVKE